MSKLYKKISFVHDHIIYRNGDNFYTNGNFPPSVIKRYSGFSEEFVFISRGMEVEKPLENLTPTYIKNGEFKFYSNKFFLVPLLRGLYYQEMKKILEKSCLIIVRLPSFLGMEAIRICSKNNMLDKVVIEIVGNLYESLYFHGSLLLRIIAQPLHKKMKKIVCKSENTIYITENYLQNVYPSRKNQWVIPNVILPEEEYLGLKNINPRYPKNNILTIGIVGSLNVSYKGHRVLLEALNSFQFEKLQIEVQMVGQGSDSNIDKIKNDNINSFVEYNYLGTKSHDNLLKWLREIDLLIQPSLTEAQGRVIIEAMSQGCFVLASEVGGIVELLDSSCLFLKNDTLSLKTKLKEYLRLLQQSKESEILDILHRNYIFSLKFSEKEIYHRRKRMMKEIKERENSQK